MVESLHRGSAKNLTKSFALLQAMVGVGSGLKLAELSRLVNIPKPIARRLLFSLCGLGMLREDRQGKYSLGHQCMVLTLERLKELAVDVKDAATRLSEKVGYRHGATDAAG